MIEFVGYLSGSFNPSNKPFEKWVSTLGAIVLSLSRLNQGVQTADQVKLQLFEAETLV